MSRYKYWFQFEDPNENDYGIVIAEFRNVYDWVIAMHNKPEHSPAHWNLLKNNPIAWKDFVTRPWTMSRERFSKWLEDDMSVLKKSDKNGYLAGSSESIMDVQCHGNFTWKGIIPCSMEDRKRTARLFPYSGAIYELDRNNPGTPYKNILELRRDKIINFKKEVPKYKNVRNYIAITYEDMLQKGTDSLIRQIEEKTGVTAKCMARPPKDTKIKDYPEGFIEWMNEQVDWEAESLVGYSKKKLDTVEKSDVNSKLGIHLIGERHSGTNWIVSHLEQCFAHTIEVSC